MSDLEFRLSAQKPSGAGTPLPLTFLSRATGSSAGPGLEARTGNHWGFTASADYMQRQHPDPPPERKKKPRNEKHGLMTNLCQNIKVAVI